MPGWVGIRINFFLERPSAALLGGIVFFFTLNLSFGTMFTRNAFDDRSRALD